MCSSQNRDSVCVCVHWTAVLHNSPLNMEERVEYLLKERENRGNMEKDREGGERERKRERGRELAFPPFLSWVLSVLMLTLDLDK